MGVLVAHDLLKILLTLVVLALVVAAVALFVSGYLSAYKKGGKSTQAPVVAGVKSGRAAVPSPSATIAAGSPFSQYARPAPSIMPAPVPAGVAAGPPVGLPGPPLAAPSRPSFAVPAVPSAPGISGIVQVLFRLLPLIFHHQFDMTPIWPQLSL